MKSILVFSAVAIVIVASADRTLGQEREIEIGKRLAKALAEQFDNREIDFRLTISTNQPDWTLEERGSASLARTAGAQSIRLKLDLVETSPGEQPSKRVVSQRTIVEANGGYKRIIYVQKAASQSPSEIDWIVVGSASDLALAHHSFYSKAGVEWLISVGLLGLGGTDLIAIDSRLSPSGVSHNVDEKRITYKSVCGQVDLVYETANEKNRIRSISVFQRRDDVLTIALFPDAGLNLKLRDCKQGPGFPSLDSGLDLVDLLLDFQYDSDGNIERMDYRENSKAGKRVATKVARAVVTTRASISSETVTNKYLATIPNGTKAAVVNDQISYVWEDGKLKKDTDQSALEIANRAVFQNESRRNLIVLAIVIACAALAVFFLIRRRKRRLA